MKKKYTISFLSTLVSVLAISLLFNASVVRAQTSQEQPTTQTPATVQNIADNVCRGVVSADTGRFSDATTLESCKESSDGSFGFLAQRIINIFSLVVGVVSVIMIIVGGFRYIISGGDSSSVQGAKNTILYAIVGLIIVVFAQVIIRFVLTNVAPSAG